MCIRDKDEAVQLREAGIRQPILLLEGFFAAADLALCACLLYTSRCV